MSEIPSLKRDGTMEVTAQAGKEFLASHGMTVTDDDVKTRGQKDKLEEISAVPADTESAEEKEEGENDTSEEVKDTSEEEVGEKDDDESCDPPPKMVRDGTMVVTAKEGEKLLDGEELEKTRAKTAAEKAEKALKSPRIKRTTTIAQTTEAGTLILGRGERGRTRSQTRKKSESGDTDKKTPTRTKRTKAQANKDGDEETPASEAKKAKLVGNGNDKIAEVVPDQKN